MHRPSRTEPFGAVSTNQLVSGPSGRHSRFVDPKAAPSGQRSRPTSISPPPPPLPTSQLAARPSALPERKVHVASTLGRDAEIQHRLQELDAQTEFGRHKRLEEVERRRRAEAKRLAAEARRREQLVETVKNFEATWRADRALLLDEHHVYAQWHQRWAAVVMCELNECSERFHIEAQLRKKYKALGRSLHLMLALADVEAMEREKRELLEEKEQYDLGRPLRLKADLDALVDFDAYITEMRGKVELEEETARTTLARIDIAGRSRLSAFVAARAELLDAEFRARASLEYRQTNDRQNLANLFIDGQEQLIAFLDDVDQLFVEHSEKARELVLIEAADRANLAEDRAEDLARIEARWRALVAAVAELAAVEADRRQQLVEYEAERLARVLAAVREDEEYTAEITAEKTARRNAAVAYVLDRRGEIEDSEAAAFATLRTRFAVELEERHAWIAQREAERVRICTDVWDLCVALQASEDAEFAALLDLMEIEAEQRLEMIERKRQARVQLAQRAVEEAERLFQQQVHERRELAAKMHAEEEAVHSLIETRGKQRNGCARAEMTERHALGEAEDAARTRLSRFFDDRAAAIQRVLDDLAAERRQMLRSAASSAQIVANEEARAIRTLFALADHEFVMAVTATQCRERHEAEEDETTMRSVLTLAEVRAREALRTQLLYVQQDAMRRAFDTFIASLEEEAAEEAHDRHLLEATAFDTLASLRTMEAAARDAAATAFRERVLAALAARQRDLEEDARCYDPLEAPLGDARASFRIACDLAAMEEPLPMDEEDRYRRAFVAERLEGVDAAAIPCRTVEILATLLEASAETADRANLALQTSRNAAADAQRRLKLAENELNEAIAQQECFTNKLAKDEDRYKSDIDKANLHVQSKAKFLEAAKRRVEAAKEVLSLVRAQHTQVQDNLSRQLGGARPQASQPQAAHGKSSVVRRMH